MVGEMNDLELERELVEENSPAHYPTSDDDEQTPEEEHAEAQQTGEVFKGQQNGGGL